MNSNTERSLQDQLVALEQDTAREDIFRLAQARKNALQQKPKTSSRGLWPAIATGFASAILIAVFYSPTDSLLSPTTELNSDDYYSELSDDNFELYDDLEFYDWLADIET